MKLLKNEASSLRKESKQLDKSKAADTPPAKSASEFYIDKERFSLAMRGADDGMWDWDLKTGEVYYSPRWKSILGYAEHELEHTIETWEAVVHPDDKDAVIASAKDYIEGRASSFQVELRMMHKDGYPLPVLSRAFLITSGSNNLPRRLVGTLVDQSAQKRIEEFNIRSAKILEMIAVGQPAKAVYDAIALMYEDRHPGIRCSLLELRDNKLLHGGAPSMPKVFYDAVHGLENGPNVGSCGASTYLGERVVVEDIATDSNWSEFKHLALPHELHACWSEPVKSSTGKVLGAFSMYHDHPALPNEEQSRDLSSAASLASIVMERDFSQRKIRELAYTDDLTNLPSRNHFYQKLRDTIAVSDRYGRHFGVLYIDLDDFKSINDSLGHDAGDELLKAVAGRIKAACREIDFVARLSGDEFCVIVEETEESSTSTVAERCLHAVSQPIELVTRIVRPTCSVGIARYPGDGADLSSLIKAADTSLYTAKENGRNRYALYKPEFTQKAEYRFQVEQYLRVAIEQQQLTLAYQPQIDAVTGEIVGVEALSRWNHPELGSVSPIDFINTAERIGMIKPLTEWVLMTACRQLVAWREMGVSNLRMAVNISPSHFLDPDIVPLLRRVISETGITPAELELEVTESVVQTDQRNLAVFKSLKDLGIQLAIDDFGIGYSSFASLKHLNVDRLKIDKYFVDDMIVDEKAKVLVSSMIDMAQKLGYRTTAEGVETEEQFDALKALSCDSMQGYLFSKPLDAEGVQSLLLGQKGSS